MNTYVCFSILANGGVFEGNQVLKPETLEQMFELLTGDTCSVSGLPVQWGRGLQIMKNPFVSRWGEGGGISCQVYCLINSCILNKITTVQKTKPAYWFIGLSIVCMVISNTVKVL